MDATLPPSTAAARTGRWTADQRAAAFAVYYRTGSRRKARKETGVPERTLSMWLRDPRYEEERKAVQAGLIEAVQKDAARRGIEVAEATREAILVCRKQLRRDPDGKTASSLLTALSRARETEDRIQRLDEGKATEIAGVVVAPEDEEAFREWYAEHRARKGESTADLERRYQESVLDAVREMLESGYAELLRQVLALVAASAGIVTATLRDDLPLALQLRDCAVAAVDAAERDARAAERSAALTLVQRGVGDADAR